MANCTGSTAWAGGQLLLSKNGKLHTCHTVITRRYFDESSLPYERMFKHAWITSLAAIAVAVAPLYGRQCQLCV